MTKAEFRNLYKAYCTNIGRDIVDTNDDAKMQSELDSALEACSFYTGWDKGPFVCYDDAVAEVVYANCTGVLLALGTGIKALTELKIDDNVISSTYYRLINVRGDGLFFGIKIDEQFITLDPMNTAKATGIFGRVIKLSDFEKNQIYRLANGLAGKDVMWNLTAQSNNIAKLVSGSESVTYNVKAMSADNIFTLFSYFGDCKSILIKYRRFAIL